MLDVVSPYTGQIVGTVPTLSASELESRLVAAHALFRDRSRWLSVHERATILMRAAELLASRVNEFAQLIALEGAKPLKDALVEARRAAEGLAMCADHIRQDVGRTIPLGLSPLTQGHMARTIKEPIGVVAAVSAFNHPLNLIVHQVAPAIAAGCPVIVKPAKDTPLCCMKFIELLSEAGLPEDWCAGVMAENSIISAGLVSDPRIGFFSFIGSARVGWMLRSSLAPGVRCALEHGGAAPVIVCADADLDELVPALLKGGFYHAGQVCVSVQRIFVPNTLKQTLVERLVEGTKTLQVGDPLNADTDIGPLIRPAEIDRVEQWVTEAVDAGTTLACGGTRINDRVFPATILVDPPADTKVACQEIFGPVVCVFGYDDERDAVAQANALPVAFQASVFTQNIDHALELAGALDGSAIMINEHTAFRDDVMPFAGLRQSGLGVGGIPYTIEDMQIDKMIVMKSKHI